MINQLGWDLSMSNFAVSVKQLGFMLPIAISYKTVNQTA